MGRISIAVRSYSVFCPLFTVFLLICIGATGIVYAQERTEITADYRDIPDMEPPVIDGELNDPVWQYATQGRAPASSWNVRSNPNFPSTIPCRRGRLTASKETTGRKTTRTPHFWYGRCRMMNICMWPSRRWITIL